MFTLSINSSIILDQAINSCGAFFSRFFAAVPISFFCFVFSSSIQPCQMNLRRMWETLRIICCLIGDYMVVFPSLPISFPLIWMCCVAQWINRMWVFICSASQSVSQSSLSAISMCDLNVERDIDIRWTTTRIVLTFQFRCIACIGNNAACAFAICTLQIVLQLVVVQRISIVCIGRMHFELQPELGQTDRSKPLANEMTFVYMHCFRCTAHKHTHTQRTRFYDISMPWSWFLFFLLFLTLLLFSILLASSIEWD